MVPLLIKEIKMGIVIERNFPVLTTTSKDFADNIEVTVRAEGDHSECSCSFELTFAHDSSVAVLEFDNVISDDYNLVLENWFTLPRESIQRIALEMNYARIMFEVGYHMQ